MYKTVRQGDASLQYTILPQIDEFYGHDVSSVRGPPPFKGHYCPAEDRNTWLPGSRILCLMLTILLITLLITCSVIAMYVVHVLIRGPSALVTTRVLITKNRVNHKVDKQKVITSPMTTPPASKMLSNDPILESSGRSSTSPQTIYDEEEAENFDFTMTGTVSPSSEEARLTSRTSSTEKTSASTSSSLDVDAKSSDSRASIIEAPTNNVVNLLRKLKMQLQMPRVTLKLRINDTVPQMYMKAGIASYKKGKITTSVLANGLSLERLIFRTPYGTIKPWRQTWPFVEESVKLQQKQYRIFWRDVICVTLVFLMLGSFILVLRMLRISGRPSKNIEEAEVESQDETQSVLLNAQTGDPEDKE